MTRSAIDRLTILQAERALAAATRTEYHPPTEELMWPATPEEDVWYSAHAPNYNDPDWDTLRVHEVPDNH